MPFSNNYKKLGKNKAFLLQDLENTQHTWASQVRSLVGERERRAPGVLLYWGQYPPVGSGFILIDEFKAQEQ